MLKSNSVVLDSINRRVTARGSIWRWRAAGLITRATAQIVRIIEMKWSCCWMVDNFSLKPWLKTAINWKPNSAWMPGSTIRHSSSMCLAAESNDSCSFWSAIVKAAEQIVGQYLTNLSGWIYLKNDPPCTAEQFIFWFSPKAVRKRRQQLPMSQ